MKINLHIHSEFSQDGNVSLEDIIKLTSDVDTEVISITDHNNVDVYMKNNIKSLLEKYNIKIINGIEIKTSYKGVSIEILGYGIDIYKMEKYMNEAAEKVNSLQEDSLEYFKSVSKKLGLKYDDEKLEKDQYAGTKMYYLLDKYRDFNSSKLESMNFKDHQSFYRNCICDKNSDFFFDESNYLFSPKKVIDIIHECGGKAFIAHPKEYTVIKDKYKFFNDLAKDGVDGVECYYVSHTNEEIYMYKEYCDKNNLLISGGTDFHDKLKRNIIKPYNLEIDWINEYI